jgi:hypothetical protein
MAALTVKDSSDRQAFNSHWQKILADPSITIRTILRVFLSKFLHKVIAHTLQIAYVYSILRSLI